MMSTAWRDGGGACVDGQLLGLGKVYVVCWFV